MTPQLLTDETSSITWRLFTWAIVLAYSLFTGIQYADNIILVQALGGWSPMDWVAHQLLPENFKADFPSGIEAYKMSSFMHLYLAIKSAGINTEMLMQWVIPFEAVFLGMAAAILFRALSPKLPYVAMAIFAILIVEGSARDMELARFGGGFYQGLFYNIADGLCLLGLAALFRKQVAIAALLLGLAFTVHPVLAGMACLFATPYVLLSLRQFQLRSLLLAGIIFIVITSAWILTNFRSAEITAGAIPNQEWLELVRMFTSHWFPVDIGVFTRFHERYILPVLCLLILTLVYFTRVVETRELRLGVACGLGLLATLAFAGVIISEFSSEPFLIKLALHRASNMLIIVCLLIVVAGLTRDVLNGRFFEVASGGALILSPLINAPVSFPVLLTIIHVGLYIIKNHYIGNVKRLWPVISLSVALLLTVSLYYLIGIQNSMAYLGAPTLWKTASGLLIFILMLSSLKGTGLLKGNSYQHILGIALLSTVLIASTTSVERKSAMSEAQKHYSSDFIDAQHWARSNTSPSALFMVDPTMDGYGWRDFSQRSSFGNLREWLHTSWLYDSQVDRYTEGLKRFNEFGINIEPYKQIRPSIEGFHSLSRDLRKTFYSKDDAWLQSMSRRYQIDYVVFQKKFIQREINLTKVFENKNFVVYKL